MLKLEKISFYYGACSTKYVKKMIKCCLVLKQLNIYIEIIHFNQHKGTYVTVSLVKHLFLSSINKYLAFLSRKRTCDPNLQSEQGDYFQPPEASYSEITINENMATSTNKETNSLNLWE